MTQRFKQVASYRFDNYEDAKQLADQLSAPKVRIRRRPAGYYDVLEFKRLPKKTKKEAWPDGF